MSSCVESGFAAHSAVSRAARHQRPDEVRGLGRHVQAGGDPDAVERALGGEALADRAQHRHLPVGPLDAGGAGGGEGGVGDVAGHQPGSLARGPAGRAAASRYRFTRHECSIELGDDSDGREDRGAAGGQGRPPRGHRGAVHGVGRGDRRRVLARRAPDGAARAGRAAASPHARGRVLLRPRGADGRRPRRRGRVRRARRPRVQAARAVAHVLERGRRAVPDPRDHLPRRLRAVLRGARRPACRARRRRRSPRSRRATGSSSTWRACPCSASGTGCASRSSPWTRSENAEGAGSSRARPFAERRCCAAERPSSGSGRSCTARRPGRRCTRPARPSAR